MYNFLRRTVRILNKLIIYKSNTDLKCLWLYVKFSTYLKSLHLVAVLIASYSNLM